MIKKPVDLIGAAIGLGAKRQETAFGPRTLKTYGLIRKLLKYRDHLSWRDINEEKSLTTSVIIPYADREKIIAEFSRRLAKLTALSIHDGHFPIVLGGDHTIALGTWPGIIEALNAKQQFGLIWIDAHMDSHTIETTPSQAIHGMPLAVLLGHGDPQLINIAFEGAKINPKHVVLIGVRSFETGEAELLSQLNVKIFYQDEVKSRGFKNVFKDALNIVKQNTTAFGVSLDLDAFDPEVAPGVGSPELDGLTSQEIKEAFKMLSHDSAFVGLEISEYNPERDVKDKTAKLIKSLLLALLKHEVVENKHN